MSHSDDLYIQWSNIFENRFTEVVEVCYLVLYNGDICKLTSYEENSIEGNAWVIEEIVKSKGFELSYVAIIVHSHFASPRFSTTDKTTLRHLRSLGYGGSFLLYVTATGKMYELD